MYDYYEQLIEDFLSQMVDDEAKYIIFGKLMLAMEREDISFDEYDKLIEMLNLSKHQIEVSKQIPGYEYQE